MTGNFSECYWDGKCQGIVDEYWHDCYWWPEKCLEEEVDVEEAEELVRTFEQWLACYSKSVKNLWQGDI